MATSDLRPDDAAIRAALPRFTGDIQQVPPRYSAVKVEGRRAYALAREGEALDLAARPLHVEALDLVGRPDADHAELELICGKGGYVRSIARDLGDVLGCHAHVTALRRIWSGPFDLVHAVQMDAVEAMARTPELDALLLPLETALEDLPRVTVNEAGAARLGHGNPAPVISADCGFGDACWASFRGRPLAIGSYRAGEFHPSRVFNLPA